MTIMHVMQLKNINKMLKYKEMKE